MIEHDIVAFRSPQSAWWALALEIASDTTYAGIGGIIEGPAPFPMPIPSSCTLEIGTDRVWHLADAIAIVATMVEAWSPVDVKIALARNARERWLGRPWLEYRIEQAGSGRLISPLADGWLFDLTQVG